MRLLQVNLRSFLLYTLVLVFISIPISFFTIRRILNHRVDESLQLHRDQFLKHIKSFEYLDDLAVDLMVLDQLSYDIRITPATGPSAPESWRTVVMFDSLENEEKSFRELSSGVVVKQHHYTLAIRESLVENDELAVAIGLVQAIMITLLALGFMMINRSISSKLWLPFYSTLARLKQFEIDQNKPFATEESRIDEFNDLNLAIRHLTKRNKEVYQQQKEFTENASHEMQTPLAIFQTQLDTLMQSPDLTEHLASSIQEMASNAQRMGRLNKSLLLLSRLDNGQFSETESIDIAGLIETVAGNLKLLADVQEIVIKTDMEPGLLVANKALLEVLVNNLLTNALRYNQHKGSVFITWKACVLEVVNTGPPLTLPIEKLFERFRKENKNLQSSGLGLAIVKKICDTFGYGVRYHYSNEGHHFTITF